MTLIRTLAMVPTLRRYHNRRSSPQVRKGCTRRCRARTTATTSQLAAPTSTYTQTLLSMHTLIACCMYVHTTCTGTMHLSSILWFLDAFKSQCFCVFSHAASRASTTCIVQVLTKFRQVLDTGFLTIPGSAKCLQCVLSTSILHGTLSFLSFSFVGHRKKQRDQAPGAGYCL